MDRETKIAQLIQHDIDNKMKDHVEVWKMLYWGWVGWSKYSDGELDKWYRKLIKKQSNGKDDRTMVSQGDDR